MRYASTLASCPVHPGMIGPDAQGRSRCPVCDLEATQRERDARAGRAIAAAMGSRTSRRAP